jgi:hypothetical protein
MTAQILYSGTRPIAREDIKCLIAHLQLTMDSYLSKKELDIPLVPLDEWSWGVQSRHFLYFPVEINRGRLRQRSALVLARLLLHNSSSCELVRGASSNRF